MSTGSIITAGLWNILPGFAIAVVPHDERHFTLVTRKSTEYRVFLRFLWKKGGGEESAAKSII
jgi:hypothetical protein